MIDPGVAYDKLASMESADEIAEFFHDQGVQGTPCSASRCAISEWVRQSTTHDVSTGTAGIIVLRSNTAENTGTAVWYNTAENWPLTEPMKDFIHKFDRGEYPAISRPHPWSGARLGA